jgi:hypothetical protein
VCSLKFHHCVLVPRRGIGPIKVGQRTTGWAKRVQLSRAFPLNALVQSQVSSAHTPFATLRTTKNTCQTAPAASASACAGGCFWWAGDPACRLRFHDQPAHHKTPPPVSPQLEPPKIPLLLDGRASTSPSLSSTSAIIATSPPSLSCVPLLSHPVAASVYRQASSIFDTRPVLDSVVFHGG